MKSLRRERRSTSIEALMIQRIVALGLAIVLIQISGLRQVVSAAVHDVQPPTFNIPADLVLVNGKVITVNTNDSIAEAIAIRSGKIVAVGSNSEIERLVSASTRVIDLHGHVATPGLIDAHGHFADGGVNELYHVDLSDAARIDDVLQKIRKRVATLKPGEWVLGDGWDEGKLQERRYVYAKDLDPLTPNNPVWLTHTTGHYGVANSVAMKMAHISAETQAPAAGTIDRNAQGLPTGVLKESAMA